MVVNVGFIRIRSASVRWTQTFTQTWFQSLRLQMRCYLFPVRRISMLILEHLLRLNRSHQLHLLRQLEYTDSTPRDSTSRDSTSQHSMSCGENVSKASSYCTCAIRTKVVTLCMCCVCHFHLSAKGGRKCGILLSEISNL